MLTYYMAFAALARLLIAQRKTFIWSIVWLGHDGINRIIRIIRNSYSLERTFVSHYLFPFPTSLDSPRFPVFPGRNMQLASERSRAEQPAR